VLDIAVLLGAFQEKDGNQCEKYCKKEHGALGSTEVKICPLSIQSEE
jgi:hypothetical protein